MNFNYNTQNAAFLIDPSSFEADKTYEITLLDKSTSMSELQNYITTFDDSIEMIEGPINNNEALLQQANDQFKTYENQLDYTVIDGPNEKVVVIPNNQNTCPFLNKDFFLSGSSVILSPKSMSPASCTTEDEFEEIQVGLEQTCKNEPRLSVKDVIEQARSYASKIAKKGPNKRGRPATKNNEDILHKIEVLKKINDKKGARVAKNVEASRRYRRNLSERREKIDQQLEAEMRRFDELTARHRLLKEEINRLKLSLHATIQ